MIPELFLKNLTCDLLIVSCILATNSNRIFELKSILTLNKLDAKVDGSSMGSYAALAGRLPAVSGFFTTRLSSIVGSGLMPGLSTADLCD